ncbi:MULTISPECIES: recombinase family protein [unclassified Roseofilum]|uniref:recombinase family protein n=1 Tax=unclassified Roseofilum TaxID=2620099 RepID=UPI000E8CBE7C|nr:MULTISPECIES: recombinase family protein [unclassified Roseofilum]MBP0007463.1 recombinase family protein [Roseofilum sp. Belize Diploria]MBP0032476.1 recombinase family protein [Roseofilum sp. Belize BBD 4]HBQ99396.1 recombinase family protein [Cyanobacteria bacterium UBA11691]
MKILAYVWCDPILESPPKSSIWGWEVDRIYQDLGGREELKTLFQDLAAEEETGEIYLLIRRLEELGDNAETMTNALQRLETQNVQVIPLQGEEQPRVENSDILHLFNRLQTYYHSLRIRQGHAQNRLQAKPPPGKAPYGYKRNKNSYSLDRSYAPVVKDFFDHFLLYGSVRAAVRYLNQKYRKTISVSTGKRWLTNPVYRGDTAFKNGEILSDTHTPILSREEAAQIDRLLRRNRRLPPRSASAPRSLSGLVSCQNCQSGMKITRVTRHRQPGEYLYLRPIHCPRQPKCKGLRYEQVLDATITKICQDLQPAVAKLTLPDLEQIESQLQQKINQNQKILDQLPELKKHGILDAETADLRTYKIRSELSKLQANLAALPPVNLTSVAQAVSIPQFWLDLSEAERRFYLREFIRQIQLIRHFETSPPNWSVKLIFIF